MSAGPYRIATELRSNGFTTQVVDLAKYRTFNRLHELVLKKFVDKDTFWIGFSTNFMNHIIGYPYVNSEKTINYLREQNPNIDLQLKRFMEYARSLNPNVQFILGGVRLFSCSYLGFVEFRGHTDQQIVEYTKSLSKKVIPPYDVVKNDEYKSFPTSKIVYTKQDVLNTFTTLPIETSRGCIFKCKFCAFALNGKTKGEWIKRAEVLQEEIIYNYEQFGISDYIFTDDTYNDSVEKITNLKELVFDKLPFKINFTTWLRFDLICRYPHTAEILKESGLIEANLGIETMNKKAAKIIGKGTDPEFQMNFLRQLHETSWKNVVSYTGWILGLPTDTKESLINFLEWMTSEENPVHHNRLSTLGLNPHNSTFNGKIYNLYQSEFELNYDKLCNVEFYEKNGRDYWKSKDTDLDEEWCSNIEHEYGQIFFKKFKISNSYLSNKKVYRNRDRLGGRFMYPSLISLGLSKEDIIHMPASLALQKYDLTSLSKIQEQNYMKTLLNL
jgi:radical SAM superfamily enzyme YgiQ (UPF0313 family)